MTSIVVESKESTSIKKILVMIQSCTIVCNKPLSYSWTRSVYNTEERLEQLLNSIRSVKKYIPRADILVCELSDITDQQKTRITNELSSDPKPEAWGLIMLNTPDIVSYRDGLYKNHAEIISTLTTFKNINLQPYDFIFKLSGRYEITEIFNINLIDFEKYYIKDYEKKHMTTILYGVPKKFYQHFMEILTNILKNPVIKEGIEHILYPFIKDYAKSVEQIGAKGFIAPVGEYITV